MMDNPLLSVITVCRNAKDTIENTLLSVANQHFTNFEYIVIDGASTDGTLEILNQYKPIITTLISEPDKGIYDAMNKGVKLAIGDWIYFLGADDVFYNDLVLEEIFSFISDFNTYDFIYGNVLFKNKNIVYDGKFDKDKLYSKNICHQAIFYHRSVFQKIGGFNTEFKYVADYDFNLRIWAQPDARILFVEKIIAIFNEQGFSSKEVDTVFYSLKDELLLQYDYFCNQSFQYSKNAYYKIRQSREYKLGKLMLSPIKKAILIIQRLFYR